MKKYPIFLLLKNSYKLISEQINLMSKEKNLIVLSEIII